MWRAWLAAAAAAMGLAGCAVRSAQADPPPKAAEVVAELDGRAGSGGGECRHDDAWRARLQSAQKSTDEALRRAAIKIAHRENAAPDMAKLSWGARQIRVSEDSFAQAAWSADGHSHVFWFRADGSPIGNVALPGSLSEPIADENGDLYAVGIGRSGEGYVVKASPTASIKWAKKLGDEVGPELVPAAVFDGQLVLTDGRVLATGDGASICAASSVSGS